MKIAYVCADAGVPVFGQKGCSLHVQEMVRAFRNLGAEVTLFATTLGGEPAADLRDLRVVQLAAVPRHSGPERETVALAANPVLASTLMKNGPFDLVYERYSLWSHAGLSAASEIGVASVLEVNAPLIEEQQQYRTLHNADLARQVARAAFAAADVLIGVSDEVAAYLSSYSEAAGKVHVIANGVNTARFGDSPPSLPAPDGTFTVGFVGTLKPWHGLEVLLQAFAMLHAHEPASRLLIVGKGPELDNLRATAKAMDIEQAVHFTGAVAPEAIPGLLASMDVGVAPYPQVEGFYFSPLKVYEYMAAGLPVVASRIGQLTQLIMDGHDGVLVEPGNAGDLHQALIALHAEPARRERIGRLGQSKVRAQHTWQSVARRVLTLAQPMDVTTGVGGSG